MKFVLAGINTVMYYSTTMIKMAGVDDDKTAIWLSCIPAFMNFAFAVLSLCLGKYRSLEQNRSSRVQGIELLSLT